MAGKSRQSFQKRQREIERQRKQEVKRQRRSDRGDPDAEADPIVDGEDAIETLDLSEEEILKAIERLHAAHESGDVDDETFENKRAQLYASLMI